MERGTAAIARSCSRSPRTPDPPTCIAAGLEFDCTARDPVEDINDFVLRMEQSYARNTNILRTSQVILVALAVIGTILLLRFSTPSSP